MVQSREGLFYEPWQGRTQLRWVDTLDICSPNLSWLFRLGVYLYRRIATPSFILVWVMRGLGGLLDCLDAQHHVVCPVYVPPRRGDCLCFFCALFSPLNVEGVYNEPSPYCNCNSFDI